VVGDQASKTQKEKVVSFLITCGKLKWVERTGWVREKVRHPETVAEHSWRLALLVILLADRLEVSGEKLLKTAILHDLEEIETKDPVTQRGAEQIVLHDEEWETEFVSGLIKGLPNEKAIFEAWQAYPRNGAGNTKESKILYQLGKLATCWQALEYELAGEGEGNFEEFWQNAYAHVDNQVILDIIKEMEKRRPK
jgi:putative hydrolase of HD superfamily